MQGQFSNYLQLEVEAKKTSVEKFSNLEIFDDLVKVPQKKLAMLVKLQTR